VLRAEGLIAREQRGDGRVHVRAQAAASSSAGALCRPSARCCAHRPAVGHEHEVAGRAPHAQHDAVAHAGQLEVHEGGQREARQLPGRPRPRRARAARRPPRPRAGGAARRPAPAGRLARPRQVADDQVLVGQPELGEQLVAHQLGHARGVHDRHHEGARGALLGRRRQHEARALAGRAAAQEGGHRVGAVRGRVARQRHAPRATQREACARCPAAARP
jgi:hypothetical protein